MCLFFKPWYNESLYDIGIKGKKILVVGASHYCKHADECRYFENCTSREHKDSSPYLNLCPYCDADLSHSTIETVEYFLGGTMNKSYRNFTDFMIEHLKLADTDEYLWSHIAFMNYVQYMLGGDENIDTNPSDISGRDYDAFTKVVSLLTPDLSVVWGAPVGNELKKHKLNRPTIQGVDPDYVFEINIDNRVYTIINCYHPCDYRCWFSNDIDKLQKQFDLLL